jgi:hypothetical protein
MWTTIAADLGVSRGVVVEAHQQPRTVLTTTTTTTPNESRNAALPQRSAPSSSETAPDTTH